MSIRSWIYKMVFRNHWFLWYKFCQLNKDHLTELLPAYTASGHEEKILKKEIICIHAKHYETGGLIDRLRGIVAAYEISRENNVGFRICWNNPFRLERFLVSNEVDWLVDEEDVCWSLNDTCVISAEITEESMWQEQKILSMINKKIRNTDCKQVHLYGNMRLAYEDGNFVTVYNKLFKPSKELEDALLSERKCIGGNFIAIQCRFVELMGDFKDIYSNILPPEEQAQLVERIISTIDSLHKEKYKDMPFLICTDSTRFLSEALKQLPYCYAVSGNIEHIDYATDPNSSAYLKVFLDLYLMADAHEIYRIASKDMRLSGMPYMASLIGGKKLTDILV